MRFALILCLLFLPADTTTIRLSVNISPTPKYCAYQDAVAEICPSAITIDLTPIEDASWICYWTGPGWRETTCAWWPKTNPLPLYVAHPE